MGKTFIQAPTVNNGGGIKSDSHPVPPNAVPDKGRIFGGGKGGTPGKKTTHGSGVGLKFGS